MFCESSNTNACALYHRRTAWRPRHGRV